jgi:hypothetical protein
MIGLVRRRSCPGIMIGLMAGAPVRLYLKVRRTRIGAAGPKLHKTPDLGSVKDALT